MRLAIQQMVTLGKLKKFSPQIILITCLAVAVLGMLPILGSPIQNQERIIERRSTSLSPNEPVKITTVKTKKGKVEIGKKFLDADDWFKELTIQVENTSGKKIIYIRIEISFERPEETAYEPPLV